MLFPAQRRLERGHWYVISNLSRLISSGFNKLKSKRFVRTNCLNSFQKEDSLIFHKRFCLGNESQVTQLPEKGEKIRFVDFIKQEKHPFVIYADFEGKNSETKTKHKPSGFGSGFTF